jgi:DNA-binding response OmpR family regulator
MNKILLVEDSLTDRVLMRKILERHSYDIIEKSNGESFPEFVEEENPDLILLDVVMPGISGYEICRQLKRSEKTRSIPVIFVSSKKKSSDIYWGRMQGADDYLPKPFAPENLLQMVERFLNKSQGVGING